MDAIDPTRVGLSEAEAALRDVVRTFAAREVAPLAREYEQRGEDPGPVYDRLAELGLTGIPFGAEHGGGGQPYRTYLLVVEELARAWLAPAIGLSVHTLVCDAVGRFATPETRRRVLPGLLAGERFGAYALTEPAAGSDAGALRMRARRDGDRYLLSGQKQFCTRGAEADVILTMARTADGGPVSAFLVEKPVPGLQAVRAENKMGWRSSPTWQLSFDDCPVPAANRLGEEGDGMRIALSALDAGRLGVSACSVGLAQAALDAALVFAADRSQFGRPIGEHQGVRFMLADMATQLEAGRALLRRATELKDAGAAYGPQAAMAKLFCSDTAMRVATDAVQVHGGYGYVEEFPVERYMREAKALQIVEGTNQIQRLVIGRALFPRPPGTA
ncbi:MAG: acyl-CoA dehydrogenase family protein [Actinomycetota bacterium]